MKIKRFSIGFIVSVVAFLGVGVITSIQAQAASNPAETYTSNSSVTETVKDNIDGAYFSAGKSIILKGNVNGDVYFSGDNLTVNGDVNGDIMAAATSVTINGAIHGDARILARKLTLNSHIYGSVTAISYNVNLTKSAIIERDMTFAMGQVNLDGKVTRDVNGYGTDMSINGTIGRHITYVSSSEPIIGRDAHVEQKVNYIEIGKQSKTDRAIGIATMLLLLFLMILTTLYGLKLIVPKLVATATDNLGKHYGKAALYGCAAMIFVPIVFSLSMMTLIALPLGIIVLLAYIITLLCGTSLIAQVLGEHVLAKSKHKDTWLSGFVGSIFVIALLIIPVINILTVISVVVLGSGVQIMTIFDKRRLNAKKAKK